MVKEKEYEEDEDVNDEITTIQIICNFTSFLAITFIMIGELLNEGNIWGIVIFGGGLTILNIFLTFADCERLKWEKANKCQMSDVTDNTRKQHVENNNSNRNQDFVSINIESPVADRKRRSPGVRSVYFQDLQPEIIESNYNAIPNNDKKKKKKISREKERYSSRGHHKRDKYSTSLCKEYERPHRKSRSHREQNVDYENHTRKERNSRERRKERKKRNGSRSERMMDSVVDYV